MILTTSLWIGGAETVIRHLAEAVDRRRFKVTVCHLKHRGSVGDELARSGVDIVGITDKPSEKVDYFTFRKLARVIRERNIEVIHAHTTHALVDACLCKLLMPRLKVVNTFHFGNYPHTRPRILWMERIFSRLADRLLAVGEVQRRQICSVFRLRDRAVSTIWNGVTITSGPGDPTFRARIGAEKSILVGTIATLIKQKGLFDLLKVARRVRDAGHDVKFVIIGEGQLRAQLEAERRELGLDDTVVLTGWMTNAADLALPVLDIFFQPSLWEAMSMVILEAMAAARPIVATRVGETPQVIEDGIDGLLVRPGDIDGMAAALERLIVEPSLRQRLGAAARRKVEQRFTVDRMTRAYEQEYLSVLS